MALGASTLALAMLLQHWRDVRVWCAWRLVAAGAVGTPVGTADSTVARELLSPGATAVLVPPGDPDALAAALRELINDRELLIRVGRAGHDLFRREASPDVLGRRLAGLLGALVEDAGVRRQSSLDRGLEGVPGRRRPAGAGEALSKRSVVGQAR